jgi:hypothetical protein
MASSLEMHWFVAVLVFESGIDGGWADPSVDVQFRLVRAADPEAAYKRALALGRDGEQGYENPYGQTCTWSFKGLKDLQEVDEDELADGVEVYGFIRGGSAEEHVIPKEQLTAFLEGGPITDDPGPWD